MCGTRFHNLTEVFKQDFDCIISEKMKREIGRRKDIFTEIYECKICNYDTLVYCENSDQDPNEIYSSGKWICLSCGEIVSSIDCDDCGEPLPFSAKIFVQSYDNVNDYQSLCKKCSDKLESSEYGCCYEFSREN